MFTIKTSCNFIATSPETDQNYFSGHLLHPYTLPLSLGLMEGSGCPLTPRTQLDSEASSVSSERDSAFPVDSPLDSEGSNLYFERDGEFPVRNLGSYSDEARSVFSERREESEFSVAPVLDSEADSGTGSVCEEEADEAQDQVSKQPNTAEIEHQ